MNALLTGREAAAAYQARWLVPTPLWIDDATFGDAALLAHANAWVSQAADLIDAYLTLDRLRDEAGAVMNPANRHELIRIYDAAASQVRDELEQRRNDALTMVLTDTSDPDAHDDIEAIDAANDWLSESVTTVRSALNTARMNRCTTLENRRDG